MKTVDFLSRSLYGFQAGLAVAIFAVCCSSAPADTPKAQNLVRPSMPLLLALPDQWPQAGAQSFSGMRKVTGSGDAAPIADGAKSNKAFKLGCNVDIMQASGVDESIPGRLVGDCKFNYSY